MSEWPAMRHNPQGIYIYTYSTFSNAQILSVDLVVPVKIVTIIPQMCRINIDVTLHVMATKFHHNCHFSTWSKFAPSLLLLRLIKKLGFVFLVCMCVCDSVVHSL